MSLHPSECFGNFFLNCLLLLLLSLCCCCFETCVTCTVYTVLVVQNCLIFAQTTEAEQFMPVVNVKYFVYHWTCCVDLSWHLCTFDASRISKRLNMSKYWKAVVSIWDLETILASTLELVLCQFFVVLNFMSMHFCFVTEWQCSLPLVGSVELINIDCNVWAISTGWQCRAH